MITFTKKVGGGPLWGARKSTNRMSFRALTKSGAYPASCPYVTMHTPNPDIDLLAFYEIARRANLTDHPELTKSTAFQRAKELYESRAGYFREAFGKKEAIDDFVDLHLEGELASRGKRLEDVWAEFAPESLKRFPLAPGSL